VTFIDFREDRQEAQPEPARQPAQPQRQAPAQRPAQAAPARQFAQAQPAQRTSRTIQYAAPQPDAGDDIPY
jgi:hypothetical protein